MPIIQPGPGTVSFSVAATQKIQGVIKADVNILRTVKGIKLPVRCYQVNGENVGSWYTFASDACRSFLILSIVQLVLGLVRPPQTYHQVRAWPVPG